MRIVGIVVVRLTVTIVSLISLIVALAVVVLALISLTVIVVALAWLIVIRLGCPACRVDQRVADQDGWCLHPRAGRLFELVVQLAD